MSRRSHWEDERATAGGMPAIGPRGAEPVMSRLARWLVLPDLHALRSARLPIDELPAGVGEVPPGEGALLLHADAASREQLLRSLLGDALSARRVTWLCTPAAPAAATSGDVRRAALVGQLHALAWTADAARQLRQLGPARLLGEMAASGMGAQDLLVLDLLDPWLEETGDDCALEGAVSEALRSLERWARLHQGPVIAMAPARYRGQPLLPLLAAGTVLRVASFAVEPEGARLDIIRWGRGPAGMAAAARLALQADGSGRWRSGARSDLDARAALAPCDAGTVHAMRAVLSDATDIPPGWQVHATIDELVAATRDAVAATVVLAHDHPDALGTLAQVVARLRREHPQLLRIAVRETGAALRRSGELALLRLGANVVLERGLGFPHLLRQLAELGQAAASPVGADTDPASTLRGLLPDAVHGYLAPRDFCAAVERMIQRTAGEQIQHSLVHLPLLPHIAHLDALLACSPRRDGDLITANVDGVCLFLFGCAADDVMAALDSLFTVPCSELAQNLQISVDAADQAAVLQSLRRAAEEAPVDYTTILRSIAPETARAAVTATVLPIRSSGTARCVQAHVLPLRGATA